MKCPNCGRFVKDVIATVNGFDEIKKVDANCSRCGPVEPKDWEWDDFYNGNEMRGNEAEE